MTDIPLALGYDDVLLVPQRTSLTSRALADTATHLVPGLSLAIPVVSANTPWCTGAEMAIAMARAGGLGVLHRACTPEQQVSALAQVKAASVTDQALSPTVDDAGQLRAGAAVGIRGDWKRRAALLVELGVDVLVVDVAHGHADYVLTVIEKLKTAYPHLPVVGGNVATAAGTRDLINAGADAVKVGIGPGGICTTRIVAGSGVPQFTAVRNCAAEAAARSVPIIADGGIKTPGDLVKALAAGAHTAMLGSALAGADESCAEASVHNGRPVKMSTGYTTFGMQLTLKKACGEQVSREELEAYLPEGVEATYEATGPLERTLHPYIAGLRSGMSYSGAATLQELRRRAEFVRMTAAGAAEGHPHALGRAEQAPLDSSEGASR
ncbi:MAG: IMP dehydrogenase [Pseudonocardiaceae bacterium]